MKTTRVRLGLPARPGSEKIEYARNIVICITSSGNFTSPNPVLADVTTAIDHFETAYLTALNGGKSKTALSHQQEGLLDNLLSRLGNYVEITANAVANTEEEARAIILSAGMDFKHGKSKSVLPAVPSGLTAISLLEGSINLKWKSVKYARAYIIEISSNGNTSSLIFSNWTIAEVTIKTKCMLLNLNSGTKYAFRVYAIGAAGKGEVSSIVVAKIL